MNTQLNQLQRLLVEIDSLAGSVEVTGSFRESRQCAEKARSRTAKAIKIVAELDAQAGQMPEAVRTLLSRAQCEIENLAECLENVCEDEEDVDVREDVADGRVVAADIAHLLAAAPAQGDE